MSFVMKCDCCGNYEEDKDKCKMVFVEDPDSVISMGAFGVNVSRTDLCIRCYEDFFSQVKITSSPQEQ